jgi:hypothetical protein
MMHLVVVQSLKHYKNNLDGLLWLNGMLWTVSGKRGQVYGQREKATRGFDLVETITCDLKAPGGVSWDGTQLLIADRLKKTVYSIDTKNKRMRVYLDLTIAKKNAATQILKASSSEITDIDYRNGNVWITCQAGYSSSICCFKKESKELTMKFFTRGPMPLGISFEARTDLGWVLDGSNRELSQFDVHGKWTGEVINVPLEMPSGLTIDDKGMFWIIDLSNKTINQLRREA